MSNVINTNVKSLMARDSMTINQRALTTTMQRLSTGKRINSAADDAAGLGIATRMDSQIKGLNMAIKNANDTVSVVQTAEGAMQEVDSILQRMRELAVQSASDTNGSVDRAYLQAEVSQLSTEIDRIATSTQFNSMNLLDGSYKNKLFQIGANQGQTIGLSIANMKSSVLGVASSDTTRVEPGSPASTPTVDGLTAVGTGATPTVARLKFETNDTYILKIEDDVSGLAKAGITATDVGLDGTTTDAYKLDLSSKASKDLFASTINKNLKAAAIDTSISSNAANDTWVGSLTNDATKVDDFKFAISIDGGTPQKNIDILSRLKSTTLATANTPTGGEVAKAMQSELQAIYGTSITVAYAAGTTGFTVSDANGRSIDITQGAGSGAIFGTDAANAVTPLSVKGNIQSNLSVAWEGNDLVVTNKAGGSIKVTDFATTGTSKVAFDAVPDTSSTQKYDPVYLIAAKASSVTQSFQAKVEQSNLSIIFSDRTGSMSDAKYSFDLTDGAGHKYASIADLDVFGGFGATAAVSDQSVVAAINAQLKTDVATLALSDKSLSASEFKVSYKDGNLSIVNSQGRALAIENFTSDVGFATVVANNEIGKAEVLTTRTKSISEARFSVDMQQIGAGILHTGTSAGKFDLYIDGVKNTSAGKIDMNADFAGGFASGTALAAALETAIIAADGDVKVAGVTASKQETATTVTASWDETSNQVVIRDTLGRNIKLVAIAANLTPDAVFTSMPETSGIGGLTSKTDSAVTQGDAYSTSKVTMTLNQDNVKLDFAINGVYVSDASMTAGAGFAPVWNTASKTDMDAFKVKLDAVMTKLNSVHPSNVFEYEINGSALTILQRDGGPITLGGFESENVNGLKATVTPAEGQGAVTVLEQYAATALANAKGTPATTTSSVIKLNGLNDLISLSVSDGKNQYSLSATAVDTNNQASTQNFANQLNKALGSSTIKASMDTNGKIYLTDTTGGKIVLTSFTSGRGLDAVWQPESGQGESVNIGSSYSGGFSSVSNDGNSSGPVVGGGGTSVKQISVLSQKSSNDALKVIDSALTYVNSERAKLGAVENRLSHTVDNLTNIVTNTAASKSRIMDTDYAAETTELARAQIIQQAATAMLAQANQQPQSVLALLK